MSEKEKFLIELAETLHSSGLPAHRLENTMQEICSAYGEDMDVAVTPELLLIFVRSTEKPYTHMRKFNHTELNMQKMGHLYGLIQDCIQKKVEVSLAAERLHAIRILPNPYTKWTEVISTGISTASAACLFGGNIPEMLISGLIGLSIGGLIQLLAYFPNLSRLTVLFSAAFALILAKWSTLWLGSFSVEIATITGLILLIPGFTLSLSITELANGHAQSGTVRFSMAVVTFVMIAVGISLGNHLSGQVSSGIQPNEWMDVPDFVRFLTIFLVPAGFMVLFLAPTRYYLWMLLACCVSYYALSWFGQLANGGLAVFLAAFCLAGVSNVVTRRMQIPVTVMLVPGIILLVPGSIGFKSISLLVNANTLEGLEGLFNTLLSAASLTAGLLFANMLLPSKKVF
jgi:uncharacterized membrane protein YjjP (DUF1212 family)